MIVVCGVTGLSRLVPAGEEPVACVILTTHSDLTMTAQWSSMSVSETVVEKWKRGIQRCSETFIMRRDRTLQLC